MPMPNPFTPEEDRRYKEIIADCERHGTEYDRCVELLRPYHEGRDALAAVRPTYTAAEMLEFEVLEAQAKYPYREMQQCQLRLKPFRDYENVMAYAYQEAYEKARAEGRQEASREVARKLLDVNRPLTFIAQITSLSETEIE